MKLYEMKYTEGARQKSCRVGRGHDSGDGKAAGKGHKGQNTRSGEGVRLSSEDGRTPPARRLPKRGFTNFDCKKYAIINIASLDGLEDGMEVTPGLLIECELVRKELGSIKILDESELERRLSIKANRFSKSVIATTEQAGGKAEAI